MINVDDYIGFRLLDLQEALARGNQIKKIVVFAEMREVLELLFDGTIYELYSLIGCFILERCVVSARIDGDLCYATIDINSEGKEF